MPSRRQGRHCAPGIGSHRNRPPSGHVLALPGPAPRQPHGRLVPQQESGRPRAGPTRRPPVPGAPSRGRALCRPRPRTPRANSVSCPARGGRGALRSLGARASPSAAANTWVPRKPRPSSPSATDSWAPRKPRPSSSAAAANTWAREWACVERADGVWSLTGKRTARHGHGPQEKEGGGFQAVWPHPGWGGPCLHGGGGQDDSPAHDYAQLAGKGHCFGSRFWAGALAGILSLEHVGTEHGGAELSGTRGVRGHSGALSHCRTAPPPGGGDSDG